jgi:hypothetical protein
MADRGEQVLQVIREYIRPKATLTNMAQIHAQLTGGREDFTRWDDVETTYYNMTWDEENFNSFLMASKEIVEGGVDKITESYFDIVEPEEFDIEDIKFELDANLLDNDADRTEREGFRYEVTDDGILRGTYYYTNINLDITSQGEVDRLITEESIPFRINPDERLLVAESTYPAYVQKIQGIFNDTGFSVVVSGNLTSYPEQADERIQAFLNSFEMQEN